MGTERRDALAAHPVVIMSIACAATTASVLPAFLISAVAVQARVDLEFTEGGLGLAVAAFFGAAAALGAPFGRLAEALGEVAAICWATSVAAACLAFIAISGSFPMLLACLAVAGAANALVQPACNMLISRRIPAGQLGLAMSVKQSAIPLATLLGGVAIPTFAVTVGWRWAFAGGVVVAGGTALATRLLVRRTLGAPRWQGRRPDDDIATGPLIVIAIGALLAASSASALGAFLVITAAEAGMGPSASGLLLSASGAAGVATRVLAGRRADRRGGEHLKAMARMLVLGSLGYAALAVGLPPFVWLGGLIGYCMGWGWPGLLNLAVVRSSPGAPGAASGVTLAFGSTGGVLGPLLFGYAVEHQVSHQTAWIAAGVCSLVAAMVVLVGRRLLMAPRSATARSG